MGSIDEETSDGAIFLGERYMKVLVEHVFLYKKSRFVRIIFRWRSDGKRYFFWKTKKKKEFIRFLFLLALVAYKLNKALSHEAEDDELEVEVATELGNYAEFVFCLILFYFELICVFFSSVNS